MKMNTNMKALNMNELSISELETVSAGEMTREERQKVLAPKEGDGIVTTVGKAILRKVVNGLDTISDLVEPVTGKYTGEDARNAAKKRGDGLRRRRPGGGRRRSLCPG